jgi:hypothetical protein
MNDRLKTFEAMKRVTENNPELIKIQGACTLDGKSAVEQTLLRIGDILASIAVERTRQELKWGVQDLPDRPRGHIERNPAVWHAEANRLKNSAEDFPVDISWQNVLLEEVYEALAETEPDKIIGELVQCAAVIVSWVENLAARK